VIDHALQCRYCFFMGGLNVDSKILVLCYRVSGVGFHAVVFPFKPIPTFFMIVSRLISFLLHSQQ
jgi:hypothetical protein